MEYENISCEWTEAFCTRNKRSARTKSPEGELFIHSMGNLPGRRMFEASTPKKCTPMFAGRAPRTFQRGGLANYFCYHPKASRQSCPLSKLHQEDHRLFNTQSQTHGNWRGMQPSLTLKPKANIWLLYSYPFVLHHAMHTCMHDLITPILRIPPTTQLPATLDPPNALCLS